MPDRNSRKENLRSKTTLKKSKTEDKTNDSNPVAEKKDFKVIDKLVNEERNINSSDKISMIDNKDTLKMSARRKKTKISKENEEHTEVEVNKTMETPKKISTALVIDKQPDLTDKVYIESKVAETPRRRGRTAAKVTEAKLTVLDSTKQNSEDHMEVEETNKINIDHPKRNGRPVLKKKDIEPSNEVTKAKSFGHRKTTKPEVSNDIEPMEIDAPLTISKCSVLLDREDPAPNVMEIDDTKKHGSKLGRRNAFQDVDKSVNVKCRRQASRLMTNTKDSLDGKETESTVSSTPDISELTKDKDVNVPVKQTNVDDIVESRKPSGRSLKARKPFVVEKDNTEEENKEESKAEVKIPGLVMLNNIKNRKSLLASAKDTQKVSPSENIAPPPKPKTVVKKESKKEVPKPSPASVESQEKIPGLRMTADIKRRKSEMHSTNIPTTIRQSISRLTQRIDNSNADNLLRDNLVVPTKTDQDSSSALKSDHSVELADCGTPLDRTNLSTITSQRPTRSLNKETSSKSRTLPQGGDGPVECLIARAEKVPGLATTQELKDNRFNSSLAPTHRRQSGIHHINPVKPSDKESTDNKFGSSVNHRQSELTHINTSNELKPLETALPKKSKTLPVSSDKIPGLSATTQMRQQKSEINSNVDRNIFEIPNVSADKDVSINKYPGGHLSFISPIVPRQAQKPEINQPFPVTPSPFKSFRDQKPIGILSKPSPSPYKRPMSCLDQDDDVESRTKISRVTVEKRQSVTFNREVEVKEIHGNSFNSATDEASGNENEDLVNSNRKIMEEMERVKNKIHEKHNRVNNTSFSNYRSDFYKDKQRAIGPSIFAKPDGKSVTKKNSDLSDLISARVKFQSNSPPRVSYNSRPTAQQLFPTPSTGQENIFSRSNYSRSHIDSSKSGSHMKSSTLPSIAQGEVAFDWKNFLPDPRTNPVVEQSKDESVLSDSSDRDEQSKSTCVVM